MKREDCVVSWNKIKMTFNAEGFCVSKTVNVSEHRVSDTSAAQLDEARRLCRFLE